jgi:hypothetical protein
MIPSPRPVTTKSAFRAPHLVQRSSLAQSIPVIRALWCETRVVETTPRARLQQGVQVHVGQGHLTAHDVDKLRQRVDPGVVKK